MTKNTAPSTQSLSPLTINPVLFGERHDKDLRASVSGLDYASLSNVGHLFHALSEGIINNLHQMVSSEYLTQLGILRLQVSGSVPINNKVVMNRLRQLYSDCGLVDGKVQCFGGDKAQEAVKEDGRTNRGDDERVKQKLEIIMDTQGLEAVGSALGAALVTQHCSING
ncbi:sedoheptulokinase [Elysia marginata]|uniref:Sedoheptulokinase n=1 Tax=Elysia marginata TaxID=1093978 RepID=A0AAV4EZ46_9GAST|nr:sedoheptulokinase [Elysia marginata]